VLPRDLLGFELVQQLIHLIGVDTWLKAVDEDADLERRRLYAFRRYSETDSQSFVHRRLETFPAATDSAFELLGDIGVQSERRTHEDIMVKPPDDVKLLSARETNPPSPPAAYPTPATTAAPS
jgi:hypothetical protein